MQAQLNRFGGWLFVFLINCMIVLLLFLAGLILTVLSFKSVVANGDRYIYYLFIVEILKMVIVSMIVSKLIKVAVKPDQTVPGIVHTGLKIMLYACLFLSFIQLIFAANIDEYQLYVVSLRSILKEIFSVAAFSLVWMSYFRRSIRVGCYYGANAR